MTCELLHFLVTWRWTWSCARISPFCNGIVTFPRSLEVKDLWWRHRKQNMPNLFNGQVFGVQRSTRNTGRRSVRGLHHPAGYSRLVSRSWRQFNVPECPGYGARSCWRLTTDGWRPTTEGHSSWGHIKAPKPLQPGTLTSGWVTSSVLVRWAVVTSKGLVSILYQKAVVSSFATSPSGRGCQPPLRASHRDRKVAHFPIFLNLELLFCEILDCKEWAFLVCEA